MDKVNIEWHEESIYAAKQLIDRGQEAIYNRFVRDCGLNKENTRLLTQRVPRWKETLRDACQIIEEQSDRINNVAVAFDVILAEAEGTPVDLETEEALGINIRK